MNENNKKNDLFGERSSGPTSGEADYSLFEKVVPEGLKAVPDGIRRGIESLLGDNRVRNIVSEIKLPREIVAHIVSGIDETKQAAVGVVAREVRQFLENTNLADEIAKLLTQISFEVSTQVRFIPSDKAIKNRRRDKENGEDAAPPEETGELNQKPPKEKSLRDSILPKRRSRPPGKS